ncbi:hypothetical protein JHW43_002688 [Diplocarpon mali]|nr:hypothetical protein JHW43_002688 [Diplocarpon mali]
MDDMNGCAARRKVGMDRRRGPDLGLWSATQEGHGKLGAESCAPPNAVLPICLVEYEVGESGLGCVVVDERVDTDTFTSLSARQARVHTGSAA